MNQWQMNQWQRNQEREKKATDENRKEVIKQDSPDTKRKSRRIHGADSEESLREIKGSSRREVKRNEKEIIEAAGSKSFNKEAFADRRLLESSKESLKEIKGSLGSNEEVAEETDWLIGSIKGPGLRRDSITNYICWKSPYEEKEICYSPGSANQDPKGKNGRPPIYEELTCPVCKKLYVKPQLLPCNHNMCEHCIAKQKKISKQGEKKHIIVTCPVCEEKHYFTSSEKVKFPENFMLSEVINRLEHRAKKLSKNKSIKRQTYCQLCENKTKQMAVKKCETCDLNFCKECLKKHNKTYTDHNFTEPTDGENQMKCFQHPNSNLTMFCMADKVPICEDCSKEKHKDHPTSSLVDAFKDQSIHLFHIIAKYGKAKDESDNDLLRLSIFKSSLQASKIKFQKQVDDGFMLLHDQLKEKERQVRELYENELIMKTGNINNFMETTSKHLLNTEGLIQYAKEAVKEMNEFVLLQTVNQLIERLRDKVADINISAKELMTRPSTDYDLDFENISAQVNQIFSPITKKFESMKGQNSLLTKNMETDDPVEKQPENKEAEVSTTPSEYSQENNSENLPENEESAASLENGKSVEANIIKSIKSSQGDCTNLEAPMPPTIYHHIVQGSTIKIFWMVPEYDLVDSFDVQLQEISSNHGLPTPQQVGVTFSGIDASSFETAALNVNSEALFRVRAVNAIGESNWSYPYKVVAKDH